MRVLGVVCRYEVVDRWRPHDLLIRGPFSDGNSRRKAINRAFHMHRRILGRHPASTLHVSSENPFCVNYQSFEESRCDFGLGHELRIGDPSYFRLPHWWNYVDFSSEGIPSPKYWIRLGAPILQEDLLRPLKWNRNGQRKAVFVTSYLNAERSFLMKRLHNILPVEGFGGAFNESIKSHDKSSFVKRDLLSGYQYNFCPENAIAPGYVTEKILEAYASGCVPIAYADPTVSVDFNPNSIINLHDFLTEGVSECLERALASHAVTMKLMETPLVRSKIDIEKLVEFIHFVVSAAR